MSTDVPPEAEPTAPAAEPTPPVAAPTDSTVPVTHIASTDPAPGPVPALTPSPQPGTSLPEHPGKEVSADAHEEEDVPVVGFVDHRITGVDGSPINVHTPGVIMIQQPAKPKSESEVPA